MDGLIFSPDPAGMRTVTVYRLLSLLSLLCSALRFVHCRKAVKEIGRSTVATGFFVRRGAPPIWLADGMGGMKGMASFGVLRHLYINDLIMIEDLTLDSAPSLEFMQMG